MNAYPPQGVPPPMAMHGGPPMGPGGPPFGQGPPPQQGMPQGQQGGSGGPGGSCIRHYIERGNIFFCEKQFYLKNPYCGKAIIIYN